MRSQKEQQEKRYKVKIDDSNGNFKCRSCNEEFSSHVFAKNHTVKARCRPKKRKNQPKRKPRKCNEPGCDLEFSYVKDLKLHASECHSENSFSCPKCNKQFKLKQTYVRHALECKGTAKTFSCTKCDYSSFRKSDLQNHIMKHSEEKPIDDTYLCSIPQFHAIAIGGGMKLSFYLMDISSSKLKLSGKLETNFKIEQIECLESMLSITGSQEVSLMKIEVNNGIFSFAEVKRIYSDSKIKKSSLISQHILLLCENSLEIFSIEDEAQRLISSNASLVDMTVSNREHPVIFVLRTDGTISVVKIDSNENSFSNQIKDFQDNSSVFCSTARNISPYSLDTALQSALR